MAEAKPRIIYLTAGAANMFCGSCLRDNALVAALARLGCDVQLIPTYTPIRTDEVDVSRDTLFFGGVNVFLQQKIGLFRYLPRALDRFLDRPGLVRRLASGRLETSPEMLGDLAVSMLRGERGFQRKEVYRLVDWLQKSVRPNIVNLTNVLIAGFVPVLKARLGIPVVVTLQGDDLFLEGLPEPYRGEALAEIRRICRSVDRFVVFSDDYRNFMSDYLEIPKDQIAKVPLGINLQDFLADVQTDPAPRPPTIGYLARLAPEKGLHLLVEAFLRLKSMPGTEAAVLKVAGWMGEGQRAFLESQRAKLSRAGWEDSFEYLGEIDRGAKLEFLRGLDVFSVPTVYREPKGLYVLEALAAGVPVVQPDHGIFPEIISATGGGLLVRPGDPVHLAESLHSLLTRQSERSLLGSKGREAVMTQHSDRRMASETLELYRRLLD